MKPKRIILIRHGESQANVDRYLFGREPDYTIELTDKGREQAREAGKRLKELVGDESVYFYRNRKHDLPQQVFQFFCRVVLQKRCWEMLNSECFLDKCLVRIGNKRTFEPQFQLISQKQFYLGT